MIDLTSISKNLTQDESGIWVARGQHDVSYPVDGNEVCFEIEDSSFWFRHRNDVIEQLVKRFSAHDAFFDIGGGNGCVSSALQRSGTDVVLVEPGRTGVLNARQRGVRTVIHSTLEEAGFFPGSVPSAGIFDVLEHIEGDVDFLKMLCRFLRPDGTLYITVPSYDVLWSVEDDHAGHFRRYSARSLSAGLAKAGFRVEYIGYLFAFLVGPIFAFRSIPSRLGFRRPASVDTARKEHSKGNGLAAKIVNRCLSFELNRVKHGKIVPFGSSCVAVAKKSM